MKTTASMLRRGIALILKPHAQSMQTPANCCDLGVPTFAPQTSQTLLHTSSRISAGPSGASPDSPEQKKGVTTDPDIAPPKDERQTTPSNKKTNELEKGAGAPAGKDAVKPGAKPKPSARDFHTSIWSNAGPSDSPPDSPEQKKGVPTDPDIAPPKLDDARQQTPSNKKTNELEKGKGAPAGKDAVKPGAKPNPSGRGFFTSIWSAASQQQLPQHSRSLQSSASRWADKDKKGTDADSPVGNSKGDKDAPPDLNRGPSGRPDDPHMQVDQAGDDHPAPKAG